MERTWLITGCSSGLGKGIAKAVLARGDRAALTARDPAALAAFTAAYPGRALALEVAAFGIRVMLVEPGAFRRDCRDMVQKLAAQYPAAQIWVGTITVGKPSQGPWYLDPATLEDRAAYNDVLRQCVAEAGPSVHLADLTPIDGGYETVNGTHPNRAGMVTFADGWYQAMAGTVPTKG